MTDQQYPHLLVENDPETGDVLISPARCWAMNPVTGEKETIEDAWVPKEPIICPKCKAKGHWKMTVTEKHIVIHCESCKLHCWCNK